MVERYLIVAGKRGEGDLDVLLLCHSPEVKINFLDETDDVVLLHMETQVACRCLAELHELVNQLQQTFCATLGCLHGSLLAVQLIDGSLDDGQRGAEFVSDVSKKTRTEIHQLAVHLHLLV